MIKVIPVLLFSCIYLAQKREQVFVSKSLSHHVVSKPPRNVFVDVEFSSQGMIFGVENQIDTVVTPFESS